MNELRVTDPFAIEPMDEMFRQMLRPWRMEAAERAPQIKLDVHENDASYTVKAGDAGRRQGRHRRAHRGQPRHPQRRAEEGTGREEGRPRPALANASTATPAAASRSPATWTRAKAEARYKDGILELTLPKKTKTSSKRLPIA